MSRRSCAGFALGTFLLMGCANSAPVRLIVSSRSTPQSSALPNRPRSKASPKTASEPVSIQENQVQSDAPSAAVTQSESKRQQAPAGMLWVPGGTFTMGADSGGEEDEHPAHEVTLPGFWLDATEVTVRDYLDCVRAGPCAMYKQNAAKSFGAGDDAQFRQPLQPISGISWDDARTFCEFRSSRLPREAEWERAARGDDARRYPWGNTQPDPAIHACFARPVGTSLGTTCPVGSYPKGAGPYGHLDLAGNIWEWMSDYYDPFAYRRSDAARGEAGTCEQIIETQNWLRREGRQGYTGTNPIPVTCERVLRGGAFNYPAAGLRAMNRVHHPGHWRLLMAGVRCAKDAN